MRDPYRAHMTSFPKYDLCPTMIEELSADTLASFADSDGAFTKDFQVGIKGKKAFEEIFILSSTAKYESKNGAIPTVQIRLINGDKKTLYYSPVYEIGHTREFYRRDWRVPPIAEEYDTLFLHFLIPEGVRLTVKKIGTKENTRYREGEFGIRYHGHAGFPGYAPSNTVYGFQMAAEIGFTSCITIPKFTQDGIGVCFHDDASVLKILRREDGSVIEEGDAEDKPVCKFTYDELLALDAGLRKNPIYKGTRVPTMDDFFRICSMTGMQPIFSVHPNLTKAEWEYTRRLLIKYRLLDQFWIKQSDPEGVKIALEVFGNDIAGYIVIQGSKQEWDPLQRVRECGLDPKKHRIVIEYFYIPYTEDKIDEKVKTAKDEGFSVSVAAMKGGTSGPAMKKLIDLGVSEFTLDHHCSMGLDW